MSSSIPMLYDYWRSSAAYRVRIAFNLKGVAFERKSISIKPGDDEQFAAPYVQINPQKRVPSLEIDGQTFGQSMAILEWIEETYPQPSLLPQDSENRLLCRGFADTIACDVHPLNNLSVLKSLRETFGANDAVIRSWYHDWIARGFHALEQIAIKRNKTPFLFGDSPSLAEIALVPQIYNARRYGMDLSAYPNLLALDSNCEQLDAFITAKPENVAPEN